MKKPLIALLLNALILPGFGQLYLGRRNKGIALILLINLLLLPGLFLLLKVASPIVASHLSGTPITPEQILLGIKAHAFWGKLLLAALLAVWGYALFDLLSAFRAGDPPNPQ